MFSDILGLSMRIIWWYAKDQLQRSWHSNGRRTRKLQKVSEYVSVSRAYILLSLFFQPKLMAFIFKTAKRQFTIWKQMTSHFSPVVVHATCKIDAIDVIIKVD